MENQKLDALCEAFFTEHSVRAMDVAVHQQGAEIYHYRSGKTASKGAKITAKTMFSIGSISKMLTTTAVMMLVQEGKLTLDEPVYKKLPMFKMPDARYKNITVRMLLNHSSGLPGTQWKHFSASDVSHDTYYEEVYDYMAHSYLKAAPGEYSVYCNDGFTLAEMAVAAVSGMSYAQYCKDHITEPIGAHSSRLSPVRNTEYPLVQEGKKPHELLFIQGGAGYTTTMSDLCLFGNQFLTDSSILTKESKGEMAKHQGVSFLPGDTRSTGFGLGWDNVDMKDKDYDLGEGVLQKGGNSFQFTTQFIIIPKYDAVLAISETHDCGIDVPETILRLFATAMLETEGVNIYTQYQPVPQELKEQFEGTYLVPSAVLNAHLYGAVLNVTRDSTRGDSEGQAYPGHHPKVVFDENCFIYGTAAYVQIALSYLNNAE